MKIAIFSSANTKIPDHLKTLAFENGFTERSLRMIHAVDGAIVLNGRIGTLSEFTIAIEERLDVCVLKGTGGISDQLEEIIKIADRELPNKIIFEKDWRKGVDELVAHVTTLKQVKKEYIYYKTKKLNNNSVSM